jgi:anti-anti-sigma regulatory factor
MSEANAKNRRNPPAKVALPARMLINDLEGFCKELRKIYSSKKTRVVLDTGELSVIDSAGVQLLVAFVKSFTAKGGAVEWDNYSVQLYQMADELGLAGQLGG